MVVMNKIDDCHECGNEVFSDTPNYCPECGTEWESDELTFPFEVTHYFHDQVSIVEIEDGWGIEDSEHPDLVDRLRYVGYELQVTYEVGEDNIIPVAVNGNPIDYSEEYDYRENRRGYNV